MRASINIGCASRWFGSLQRPVGIRSLAVPLISRSGPVLGLVYLRQRFVRRCHCGWGGICALLRECTPNFYHRSMFIIPHGAPEGYEWFVALVVLVGLYFAVRNFMRGFRRRKPVYLKKAKPLDGLLCERPARHRDYPFFKPNPRPRPKLPLQLNPNLRSRGSAKIAALAAIVAFAVVWGLGSSPWPVMTTLRHIASAPNCGFARLVGLAPARRGEPGYWKRHDRDGDGIACEPWPPRVSNRS